jgi:hypothetical protein
LIQFRRSMRFHTPSGGLRRRNDRIRLSRSRAARTCHSSLRPRSTMLIDHISSIP